MPGPWDQPSPPAPSRRPRRPAGGWNVLILVFAVIGMALVGLAYAFPGRVSTPQEWISIAGLLAMLVAVGARFTARRASLPQVARHLALWVFIGTVLAVGYSFRGELQEAWLRVRSGAAPSTPTPSGNALVFTREDNGGFFVDAKVNGQPVHFAVDTGASDIVLSPADARRLGIDTADLTYDQPAETANGQGYGARFTAKSMTVGPLQLIDTPMVVNKADMTTSLLGMAFLKRMKSFRVEGDRLYIQPN